MSRRFHQFRRVHWPRPLSCVPTGCVVTFPKPSADDPDALLPAVIALRTRPRPELDAAAPLSRACRSRTALARRLDAPIPLHR